MLLKEKLRKLHQKKESRSVNWPSKKGGPMEDDVVGEKGIRGEVQIWVCIKKTRRGEHEEGNPVTLPRWGRVVWGGEGKGQVKKNNSGARKGKDHLSK